MIETSQGVGRVVVLVLFAVLFVAAWRSDHTVTEQPDVWQVRRSISHRAESVLAASAASIGSALPTRAAVRLAPADQTIGLTLHSDRGIGAALVGAVRVTDHGTSSGVTSGVAGATLGIQPVARKRQIAERRIEFAGQAAVLSGSWGVSDGWNAPAGPDGTALMVGGVWTQDEVDVDGLEATARVLR